MFVGRFPNIDDAWIEDKRVECDSPRNKEVNNHFGEGPTMEKHDVNDSSNVKEKFIFWA